MVVDTSALLAMLLEEPEAEACRTALEADTRRLISAASLLEAAIVIEARKGAPGARELDLFVHKAEIRRGPRRRRSGHRSAPCLAPVRPRPQHGRSEFWRSLRVCAGGDLGRTLAL